MIIICSKKTILIITIIIIIYDIIIYNTNIDNNNNIDKFDTNYYHDIVGTPAYINSNQFPDYDQ